MDRLSEKWNLWTKGAVALLGIVLIVGAWGALLGVLFTLIAEVAGLDSEKAYMWAAYTSPAWAPFAAALALRALERKLPPSQF